MISSFDMASSINEKKASTFENANYSSSTESTLEGTTTLAEDEVRARRK